METRLRIDGSIVESVTPKNCCATPVQDPRHLFPYHPIQLGDLSLSLSLRRDDITRVIRKIASQRQRRC